MIRLELSLRDILFIALAVVFFFVVTQLLSILLLVIASLILMAALLPFVNWMVAHGIQRTLAVLLLVLLFVATIIGLLALVIPALINELDSVRDNLPDHARDLDRVLDDFGINLDLERRARDIDWNSLVSGPEVVVDYGQRVLFVVLGFFTIIALTAYLLVDAPRIRRFMNQFVPEGHEEDFDRVLMSLNRVVGGYVRGQLITSLSIAVYTLVVLLVLDVENALAFAVLAGFADIVPLIGAFIAIIPPTAAALDQSPGLAAIVLLCLLAYQQFEDRFFVPRVYGSTLNVPPIVILLAVLIGAELLGIAGILLAPPAAGIGRVALDYWLAGRRPAEASVEPEDEVLAPDVEVDEEGDLVIEGVPGAEISEVEGVAGAPGELTSKRSPRAGEQPTG